MIVETIGVPQDGYAGTLVNRAVSAITQHMRVHNLGPGDLLPSELSLTKELKVSRTVVREAFKSLAALRLIELGNGRRARVAALDYGTMALMIDHGVQTDQISVQQIYDVRRTIEMRTVALAALRRTHVEAKEIVAHAAAMRVAFGSSPDLMNHDIAFHEAIARASKNPVFAMIVGAFANVTRQTWPIGWRSRESAEERMKVVVCHEVIAEAILSGDPKAATDAMAVHFDSSVKALLSAGIG